MAKRSRPIKGPGLRLKLDVRRVWECPACGRRMKRQGEITNSLCHCQEPPLRMRLVEGQREIREYQPYIVPEIQADELVGEEEASPADVPVVADIAMEAAVAEVVEEVAALVEIIEPAKTEEPPADDDFFSPEEEPDSCPPTSEETASEVPESPPSESAPEAPAASHPVAEKAPKDSPRQGRSRRRRSGRKRNRRPGSKDDGDG